MRCSKAKKLINDYIDKLPGQSLVKDLENHLETCAECREFLLDMRAIVNNAGEIVTPDPSEDLWPVIKRQVLKKTRESRMHDKGIFGRFHIHIRGPMLALSTLLVIMLMIPVLYYGINYFQGTDINNARSLLTDFQSAEQQYQSAIAALDRAIEGKFERLDPELMAVFKKNLAIIDDSIRICKESMENSLKTTEANRLLLVCYRKKIELLNEIKELTMQS